MRSGGIVIARSHRASRDARLSTPSGRRSDPGAAGRLTTPGSLPPGSQSSGVAMTILVRPDPTCPRPLPATVPPPKSEERLSKARLEVFPTAAGHAIAVCWPALHNVGGARAMQDGLGHKNGARRRAPTVLAVPALAVSARSRRPRRCPSASAHIARRTPPVRSWPLSSCRSPKTASSTETTAGS
jgi:hypothetical protein